MNIGKIDIEKALDRFAKLRQQSVKDAFKSVKYPKNVIFFIGDGMSIPTVTAARNLKNQRMANITDKEQELVWEEFPETALIKV